MKPNLEKEIWKLKQLSVEIYALSELIRLRCSDLAPTQEENDGLGSMLSQWSRRIRLLSRALEEEQRESV